MVFQYSGWSATYPSSKDYLLSPQQRHPSERRQVNLELFANRHRNKVEVILGTFDLPQGEWKNRQSIL